ncbi:MAG: glycerol-3-phosphate 1-O-acyltransferase [Alphaproteobacteria bacterium]|nr:glycerol-3-phosphate 1-O-acyltransferase [Alphaproteobacteria bacterium]
MPSPLGELAYTWPLGAAFLFAYLMGSIPFGLVLTRLAGLGDIRQLGSGSIGATNVLRTGNKALAALTLLLDSGKGAAAVLLAQTFGPDMGVLAAAGAVLGHIAPVWLRFKGGKGVATAFGAMLALAWPVALLALATWLVVALLFRYSSLAAIVAVALAPAYAWWLADWQRTELTAFIAVLVLLRHAGNVRRLLAGREPKIGWRATG